MRTWRLFSVFAVLVLVLAACGQQGSTESAAESEPAAESEGAEPSASAGGGELMAYPADGPAECGTDTNPSNISEIRAEDERTVVFTLCAPDVAFLSKIAFSGVRHRRHRVARGSTAPTGRSSRTSTAPARTGSTRGTAAATSP